MTSKTDTVKQALTDPRFSAVRILTLFSMLLSLVTLIYNSIVFSCQLSIIQNFFIPFFGASMILSELNDLSRSRRRKTAVGIAMVIGIAAALFDMIISNIHYYFLGGRDTAFSASGTPVPPMTMELILVGLTSQVFIFMLLIVLSALAGWLASIIRIRERSKH